MTIRTKLTLAIAGLLSVSAVLTGYGVLAVYDSFYNRQEQQRISLVENAAQRAAQDALLQRDDVLLLSYLNFLRGQFPSLRAVAVHWDVDGRQRTVVVGRSGGAYERVLRVSDPAIPSRAVTLELDIDRKTLRAILGTERHQLVNILVLVTCMSVLLGLGLAFWLARSMTAPLGAVVRLANEIGAGKLGGRLEWSSDDELGALVKVFNAMSQRLEELDETKKNFVSSVTHELRSPLGAIESFIHLIQDKIKAGTLVDDRERMEYLNRIQANVHRLSGFINDLLDVAKIETGKMDCVLKPMQLQDVATEVCQFFEAKSKQQGVALQNRLNGLPPVMGDADRLRQVLVNLVSNGLKFTPSGGRIEISGEQFREGDNRWVEVAVRDTGRGMAQADLSHLFKAFSQGRNVAEGVMGPKSTGLGLYITKSIVEQHGGRIEVRSVPGQGTQIAFSLRIAA